MNDNWVSVKERLPTKAGWYKIKLFYGEFEAPFITDGNNKLVWCIPDPSIITHWKNKK
jgi:hypothetical protein